MKKALFIIMLGLCSLYISASGLKPAYYIMGKDTTCQIFLYSPAPNEGLHIAYMAENESWCDMGKLMDCDYGNWQSERKMFDVYVVHAADGTWRAVWSVNEKDPCIAVAYSEDLVTWRPQDYPLMKEDGCRKPIIFPMDDGTFDIYFHSNKGNRYVRASNDFRKFEESPEPSTIEDVAWLRDTAIVTGKKYEGNLYEVPKLHLTYICDYFNSQKKDNIISAEKLQDDGRRFANLKPITSTLSIDPTNKKQISNHQIGVFFEDINYSADGGLYGELIQNRDFEYSSKDHKGWEPSTAWCSNTPIKIRTSDPISNENRHYAVLEAGDSLKNNGWDGIVVKAEAKYDFSFYAKNTDVDKRQILAVLMSDGEILATQKIKIQGKTWEKYTAVLQPKNGSEHAQLVLIPEKKGSTAVDMVSLFPEDTYKGHGLRKDLAEAIADLHPKFIRFPGGCMSHGNGIDNIYHWNASIGPWQDRKPDMNIWGYHQTRGLGFYEYFQFCEDIGAEPIPVLSAGVPCQNSAVGSNGLQGQQGGIPMADMPVYIEELLNMIDWANGNPATSKWAKMRADAGHPSPFNLKYIGIGNEDQVSTVFKERYLMICKAIKAKYPDIKVIGTAGSWHSPQSDYVEGWNVAKENKNIIDLVDEHYYESTGWFLHHQDYYDDYDRKAPKVYLGEYANVSFKPNNVESALSEALWLCNIERNGDVVDMASYAPLLCNKNHYQWSPDLIYFDNTSVKKTPSYLTQQFFSMYGGDEYLASKIALAGDLKYRIASSVVRDSRTGNIYAKIVNMLPVSLTLKIQGLQVKDGSEVHGFGGDLSQTEAQETTEKANNIIFLPPYSFRVIELK